jgi:hypothetical protein
VNYDCTQAIKNHQKIVKKLMADVCTELLHRAKIHDDSKLENPEKQEFDKSLEISSCSYGSKEYLDKLKLIKIGLQHHYLKNSHHPEYYGYSECLCCGRRYPINHPDRCGACSYGTVEIIPNISGMNLFDIFEMFIDWVAAASRHADGDIFKSIEINKGRLNMSDQLVSIFENTARNFKENNND